MSRKTDIEELRALTPPTVLQAQRAQEQDQELDQGLQALITQFMGVKNMGDPYNYMLNSYQRLAEPMTERYPGNPRDYLNWTGVNPSRRIEDRRADLPLYGPWPQVVPDWEDPNPYGAQVLAPWPEPAPEPEPLPEPVPLPTPRPVPDENYKGY